MKAAQAEHDLMKPFVANTTLINVPTTQVTTLKSGTRVASEVISYIELHIIFIVDWLYRLHKVKLPQLEYGLMQEVDMKLIRIMVLPISLSIWHLKELKRELSNN